MPDTAAPHDPQLGDFAHVDTADADDLVARLDAMHALDSFRTYKAETFALLRLGAGSTAADVGCGTGDDARRMAGLVAPGGEAVGIDLSEAMLAQARQRHTGVPNLRFAQASSDTLGAPDETFDAIRADRVLIHVPDPQATLREMMRVTKPGGRIVISEPDMPGCWVACDDYAIADQVMKEIAQSCATPYLARDLLAMFRDAGLTDVSLTVHCVTAFDPASVGRILDFGGVVRSMVAKGALPETEANRWMSGFVARGEAARFVAGVNIMIAAGTKP